MEPGALELLMEKHVVELGLELLELLDLLMEEHAVELGALEELGLELLELLDLLMEERAVELGALEEARQAAITAGSLMASRARSVPHRKAHRIRGCEAIKELLNNLGMAPRPLHLVRAHAPTRYLLDSGRRLLREYSGFRALGATPSCRPCRTSLK